MANEELLLATIDAKLTALLKAAVDNQARGAAGGQPRDSGPVDEDDDAEQASAWLGGRGTPESQNGVGTTAARAPLLELDTGEGLAAALEEIARLLALSLRRKRDLVKVVAELDAAGFDRDRIGELLGESPSRVDAALVAFDRRKSKRSRKRR